MLTVVTLYNILIWLTFFRLLDLGSRHHTGQHHALVRGAIFFGPKDGRLKMKFGKNSPKVIAVVASLAVPMALTSAAWAFQPDAPFLIHQEKNKGTWAEQDKQIDAKLAALEKPRHADAGARQDGF
jgi:predicted secreted protein